MELQQILSWVGGIAGMVITSVVSWILAKRKYNSEVDNTVIDNMQKSLDFYKTLVDDNKNRLEEVLKRNDALEDEIKELRKQMFDVMVNICYNMTCQHRKLVKEKDGNKSDKKVEKA